MNYHFDCEVELHKEDQHPSLFAWYLIEKGKGASPDKLCPWIWSFHFEAESLTVVESLERDDNGGVHRRDRVNAKLMSKERHYGSAIDRIVEFSMFGTNRTLKHIDLSIYASDKENQIELCSAWGAVSYDGEVDFHEYTEDDYLGFNLVISRANFESLVRAIQKGSANLSFKVGNVNGFYAQWDPGISTRKVKVLPPGPENKVNSFLDGIQLPRLGIVEKWQISLTKEIVANKTKTLEALQGEPTEDKKLSSFETPLDAKQVSRFYKSLRLPLWIIAALLLLLLLK